MTDKEFDRMSRLVTKALRHKPDILNLKLDKAGYCEIKKLITELNCSGFHISEADIERFGANERFSFNTNHTKIRADYGTSTGLLLENMYPNADEPPEIIYHGTSSDAINSIKKLGIIRFAKKGNARDHIFLTELKEVALKKGSRYGTGAALPVKANQMHKAGYKFYNAKNDIWLTDNVPPECIDFSNIIY